MKKHTNRKVTLVDKDIPAQKARNVKGGLIGLLYSAQPTGVQSPASLKIREAAVRF